MSDSIGVIILAAGKGTRMKVPTPKALMPALGKSLLDYVIEEGFLFAKQAKLPCEVGVVVGHLKEQLIEHLQIKFPNSPLKTAIQKEQNGTADALKACFNDHPHFWDHTYTLVACADTPLIQEADFSKLFLSLKNNPKLVGVAASFHLHRPTGYGRIIRSGNGFHIVEEKDATDEERKVTEVNSGFYILKTSHVKEVLSKISNKNKSGEFYLTDMFQDNYAVESICFEDGTPFLGVNTMEQLAEVTGELKGRHQQKLMVNGVRFLLPGTTYIESSVEIAAGTVIYPNVTILGKTKIAENVVIESGTFIKDSLIESNVHILANSYIEESQIASSASIGPMARLRPGTEIGQKAKVGNFVEIKKSKLAAGAKVSHLSYVGDAEIGENSNIGCGFITCNYDGANKHKTKIGSNTFVGSDTQMIAPVEIGDNVFIAAGSTISKSVPSDAFAIARAQQVTKEGMAKRFLKTKKSE